MPEDFVNFLKSRLIFNIFYCCWIFVNKIFIYFTFHVRISQKVKDVLMWYLQHIISYEEEDIGRFSNLHQCTFRVTFSLIFFSLSSKFIFFTKSAISSLVDSYACVNLAPKLSDVNLLNSCLELYLSRLWFIMIINFLYYSQFFKLNY